MLDIKVLGPGCTNCVRLEALCNEVVKEENLDADGNEFFRHEGFFPEDELVKVLHLKGVK